MMIYSMSWHLFATPSFYHTVCKVVALVISRLLLTMTALWWCYINRIDPFCWCDPYFTLLWTTSVQSTSMVLSTKQISILSSTFLSQAWLNQQTSKVPAGFLFLHKHIKSVTAAQHTQWRLGGDTHSTAKYQTCCGFLWRACLRG